MDADKLSDFQGTEEILKILSRILHSNISESGARANEHPFILILNPSVNVHGDLRENCVRHRFTLRETEIAVLIEKGYSYKAIANTLHISPKTVGRHLSNMYEKLEVGNRMELIKKLKGL